MSCHGHLLESQNAQTQAKKIVILISNITIEESAAMMQFLKEYRERKKQ
jgi:hypothetical protein